MLVSLFRFSRARLLKRDANTYIVTKSKPGQDVTKSSAYFAGTFSPSFPWNLLWRTHYHSNDPQAQLRPPYRAPTWSWASVDTAVIYNIQPEPPDRQSHIVFHDAESFCEPRFKEDQTGAVVSGQLTIEGALVPVILMTTQELPFLPKDQLVRESYPTNRWIRRKSLVRGPNGHLEVVSCDTIRPLQVKIGDAGYECWKLQDHWCHKCRLSERDWENVEHSCLKMGSVFRGPTETYFLVLKRSKQQGAWERVGMGFATKTCRARQEWENRRMARQKMKENGHDYEFKDGYSESDVETEVESTDEERESKWRQSETDIGLFQDARVQKVRII